MQGEWGENRDEDNDWWYVAKAISENLKFNNFRLDNDMGYV